MLRHAGPALLVLLLFASMPGDAQTATPERAKAATPARADAATSGQAGDVRARFFQDGRLRVLLLSGRNNHDWRTTTPFLRQLLVDSGRFDVRVVEEPAGMTAETLAVYDLVVSDYCGPRWGASAEQAVVDFVRGGKGLVAVHGAAYGFSGHDVLADRHVRTGITEPAWREHADMVGGWWPETPPKQFHGARHSFLVRFVDPGHPVTNGLGEGFVATDELYHQMTVLPSAHVLATAWDDPAAGGTGKDEPVLWVNTFGRGRVYYTALGHEVAAMQNEGFAAALQRGAEWAATGGVTLPSDAGSTKPGAEPLRVLVVTGGHEYPTSFYSVFEGRPEWRWTHAVSNEEAFAREIVSRFDVVVLYDYSQQLSEEGKAHLRAFAEAGKGIVVLHHALCDYQDWPWFEELVGGRYLLKDQGRRKASTYRHDVELFVKPAGSHPIVDPVGPVQLVDEAYKGMRISPDVIPLLETDNPDGDRYVAWVSPYRPARVVVVQLGHDERAHRSVAYRELVRNAILWCARR